MSTVEERVNAYRTAVKEYEIFDTALWWAPQNVDSFVRYTEHSEWLDALAEAGINGGLVCSQTARDYNPQIGNEETLKLIKGQRGLYGSMVLTPEMFFKREAGEEYVRKMRDQGMVAARIFPGRYMFSTQEFAIGRMCETLEKYDLPLIVWHIDTGWDAMDRIMTNHPKLKLVMESMDRKLLYHQRDYVALMQQHENFYMDTHNLVLFNEYDVIDELAGSKHLLFGSYFPYMTPDFSIYPVLESKLDTQKKQGILADNAKKLYKIG